MGLSPNLSLSPLMSQFAITLLVTANLRHDVIFSEHAHPCTVAV
jgi:hypothetical protein